MVVEERYAVGVNDVDGIVCDEAPAPEYDASGVDVSLIRSFLALTPAERLRFVQAQIRDILAIRQRNAGR
jgi:hypothetical protein